MAANELVSIELKAFVPARDFELSKRFYQAIGFELVWGDEHLAGFCHGPSRFLLQNFYVRESAENLMLHLLVEQVDAWWERIVPAAREFGITVDPPEDRPWGLRDFVLFDPSGVLWRIGEPMR